MLESIKKEEYGDDYNAKLVKRQLDLLNVDSYFFTMWAWNSSCHCQRLDRVVNEYAPMFILPAILLHGQSCPVQQQHVNHLCCFAHIQGQQKLRIGKEKRNGTVSLQKLCHVITSST